MGNIKRRKRAYAVLTEIAEDESQPVEVRVQAATTVLANSFGIE